MSSEGAIVTEADEDSVLEPFYDDDLSENRDGCDVTGPAQTGTDKPAIGATRGLLRSDSNEVQRYTSLAGTSAHDDIDKLREGQYSVGDRVIPVIDEIDKMFFHRFKDQIYDIFRVRLYNTLGYLLVVTRNQETLLSMQTIIYCEMLRKEDFLVNQSTKWIFMLVMRNAEMDQKGRNLIMWFMWWVRSDILRMALTCSRCPWR